MEPRYLGDGVYASYDKEGDQIWLSVGHHENRVVAIDRHVMQGLLEYNCDLMEHLRTIWEQNRS